MCRAENWGWAHLWGRITLPPLHHVIYDLVCCQEVGFELILRGHIPASTAMWIGSGKIKKEGLVILLRDKCFCRFRHLYSIPGIPFEVSFETKYLLGRNMILTNMSSTVTSFG